MKLMRLGIPLGEAFLLELAYALIVVAVCFGIYYKTKELYELTSHEGLKYFRNGFLFFGIAYLSRFLLRLIILTEQTHRPSILLFQLGFFIFIYAGIMAGFLLIYSTVYKHVKNKKIYIYLFHAVALLVALMDLIVSRRENFLSIIALLLLVAALVGFIYYRKSERKEFSRIYLLYALLFLAWELNGAAHFFVRVSRATAYTLYAISSALFVVIYLKVCSGTKEKKENGKKA